MGDNHGQPTSGGAVFVGTVLQDDPKYGLSGDGTVPNSCAVLPGTRTFLAAGTEHSMLGTYPRVIEAVAAILAGRTVSLPRVSSDPADHLQVVVSESRDLRLAATPREVAVPEAAALGAHAQVDGSLAGMLASVVHAAEAGRSRVRIVLEVEPYSAP